MQLTRYTDYSLRVLIYLSLKEPEVLVTINQISEKFSVSKNHLMKIVHQLGRLGYIHTSRGKGGGIRLKVTTDKINIGQVVRDMETTLDVVDCNSPRCPILPACKLRPILGQARDAFLDVLSEYSLSDLLHGDKQQLEHLLHWHAPVALDS